MALHNGSVVRNDDTPGMIGGRDDGIPPTPHAGTGGPNQWRAFALAATAVALAAAALRMTPALQLEVFAAAAAKLAALFTASAVTRGELGWVLQGFSFPVVVSRECSGTDFYLLVVALIGARWFAHNRHFAAAVAMTLVVSAPIAMVVNSLRIVAVAQAHRWVIPLLPERHAHFAHMLTGAAIFLPSLIALNLALEAYGNRRRPSAAS